MRDLVFIPLVTGVRITLNILSVVVLLPYSSLLQRFPSGLIKFYLIVMSVQKPVGSGSNGSGLLSPFVSFCALRC